MSPHRTHTLTPALLGACTAAGLMLAGCAGASSDRSAIGRTFAAIAHGVLAGDGRAVCGRLTQDEIDTVIAGGVLAGGRAGCPAAIATLAQDLGPVERDTLRHVRIERLAVHGDRAIATDSNGGAPDRFVRVDGRWYLSAGLG